MKKFFIPLIFIFILFSSCEMGASNEKLPTSPGSGNFDKLIILHSPWEYVYISETGNPTIDSNFYAMTLESDGWYRYEINAVSATVYFVIAPDDFTKNSAVFTVNEGEWWYDEVEDKMINKEPGSDDGTGGNGGSYFLPSPTEVKAMYDSSANKIKLTWKPVEGATSYEIWRGFTSNPTDAQYLDEFESSLPVSIRVVSAGTTYYFWVKAKNGTEISDFSSYARCKVPDQETLATPTWISATATSANSVKLLWNNVRGAEKYYVYYGTSPNSNYASKKISYSTSLEVTGLNSNTEYYFWIQACSSSVESKLSTYRLVSTPLLGGTLELINNSSRRVQNLTLYTADWDWSSLSEMELVMCSVNPGERVKISNVKPDTYVEIGSESYNGYKIKTYKTLTIQAGKTTTLTITDNDIIKR